MPKPPRRIKAKLKLPKYTVPAFLVHARNIVQSMTENPWFPSVSPPLATIQAAIDTLDAAQTATLTRAKGTREVRDEKRLQLKMLLDHLLMQIQAMADRNPENAGSIIESSGARVEKARTVKGRVFRAQRGSVSGAVDLFAPRAARGAAYEWAYSLDAGKTWVSLPTGVKASITVTGLPRGARVLFRYRAVTPKGGVGDWSDVISIIVD